MKATDVLWLSTCDASKYPLAKKQQSMEYLREIAHLRPRTQTIGCVARIRSALAFATHAFFSGQGFLHLHSPIVTASDCEGAGEMFQVGTCWRRSDCMGLLVAGFGCGVCGMAAFHARACRACAALLSLSWTAWEPEDAPSGGPWEGG